MAIHVLGSKEMVSAFALGGMRGRAIENRRELRTALDDLRHSEDLKLLVIEEQTAELDPEAVSRWKLDPAAPLLVEVPGLGGTNEETPTALEVVRRALGIRF